MSREKHYCERIWALFDALFISGLGIAMLLGGNVTPLLFVSGVLPIPFLLRELQNRQRYTPLWRLLLPFCAFFTYSIFTYFFFTGLEPSDSHPVNPNLEFYIVAIAMLGVGIVRGSQVRNLAKLLRYLLPWVLIGCFLIMTFLMIWEIRDGCRVRAAAPWPFIPALLFSTLSLLSLVGWSVQTTYERWLRLVILGMAIVVTTTYTGSRGISVAQLSIFGLLFFLGILPYFQNRLPGWYHILLTLICGTALSVLVGILTDCGPASRFSTTLNTVTAVASKSVWTESDGGRATSSTVQADGPETVVQPPIAAESPTTKLDQIKKADRSIGLRLTMWQTSLEAIKERPFFGHGSLYLQRLITEKYGFEHNHNQFLSWLVTGGLVVLTLGSGFLAIPWLVSVGLTLPDRILITLSISVLWAIAMMFDSFFNLKFYTHYYCLLCGVLYAWVNDIRASHVLTGNVK